VYTCTHTGIDCSYAGGILCRNCGGSPQVDNMVLRELTRKTYKILAGNFLWFLGKMRWRHDENIKMYLYLGK
jgi:hypothetical protein